MIMIIIIGIHCSTNYYNKCNFLIMLLSWMDAYKMYCNQWKSVMDIDLTTTTNKNPCDPV